MASPYSFNQTGIDLLNAELAKRGIGPIGATGAIAGVMGESGASLNPKSFNTQDPGGGSGGIGQWNRERLVGPSGMLAFAKNAGIDVDTSVPTDARKVPLAIQAQYLGHELDTTYAGVASQLKNATSPQQALNAWVNSYENPLNKQAAIAQRSQYLAPVGTTLSTPGLLADAQNAPVSSTPGRASAGASGSPASAAATTAAGAIGTPSGPALPGFAPAQSNQFLQGASSLDKAMGGQGLQGQQGAGDGGQDQMRPSPMIGQAPAPHIPNAQAAAQTFGTTLNAIRTPLQWGSGTPGSSISATAGPQVAAGVPQGMTAQELQQIQQLQMMQMMGGGMGTTLSSSYGGGYG